MAIFKKVAKAGKYQDDYAIHNLIAYITRPDKAPSQMIGGYGVDPDHIADSMVQISNQFNKNSRIRLHHSEHDIFHDRLFIVGGYREETGSVA